MLRKKVFSGIIWTAFEKFGILILSFLSNIVLARILLPSDYGVLSIVLIFIGISNTIIEGGFASAIIQSKEINQRDLSTAFYWNFGLGIILYGIIFSIAPLIETYYAIADLGYYIRLQGIVLLISSLNIVQLNYLTRELHFKSVAKINLIATLLSLPVAIYLALNGWGIESLIYKAIVFSSVQLLITVYYNRWLPSFVFCKKSFEKLFNFGFLIFLSNLTESLVFHFQTFLIGKFFTPVRLGFYTQAKLLHEVPERAIPQIIDKVTFPIYSSIQNDKAKVLKALITSNRVITYLNFPFMVCLIISAQPIFRFLFTSKWDDSVLYFQILCLGGLLYSLNSNNVNIVKSLGNSRFIFYSTIFKRLATLFLICCGAFLGLEYLVIGYVLSVYFWFLINSYYTGKVINYGFLLQVKDIYKTYLLSIILGLLVYFISIELFDRMYDLVKIICTSLLYLGLYFLGSLIFKNNGYLVLKDLILKRKVNE